MPRTPLSALLALCVINLIWASIYTVSKHVMGTEESALSPLAATFWRLALATAVLVPLAIRQHPKRGLTRGELTGLGLIGVVGTAIAFLAQFAGTHLSLASNAAIIVALEPVANVLLAALVLGDRLDARLGLSLLAALVGVGLLSDLDPTSLDLLSGRYALGNALMVVSILCYAVHTVVTKKTVASLPPLVVTGYPFLIATGILGLVCLWSEPTAITGAADWSWQAWAALAYMGVGCTAIAYLVWNALLVSVNVATMSLSLYIQPVFGALIAWIVLGERLTGRALLGALAVAAAIILVAVRPQTATTALEVANGTANLSENRG